MNLGHSFALRAHAGVHAQLAMPRLCVPHVKSAPKHRVGHVKCEGQQRRHQQVRQTTVKRDGTLRGSGWVTRWVTV